MYTSVMDLQRTSCPLAGLDAKTDDEPAKGGGTADLGREQLESDR